MKQFAFIGFITCLITLLLFYFYGRSVWHPIYIKFQGGKSVTEVIEKLETEQKMAFDASRFEKMMILGLKSERSLEIWGTTHENEIKWITSFPFTAYSGELGPKLREGDLQIPEGIYTIEYLNPNSSYHLSMKINYPNQFDREKGKADGRTDLGSNIFIHGKSVTIGCIPIGDPGIEKLFHMVSEMGIENVDVIISPYDMRRGIRELEIKSVDWEDELYAKIRKAMEPLRRR